MDTLLDYIKWMGALDFTACPVRDADVLVMCVISYFDLTGLFQDGQTEAHVRDCAGMLEEGTEKLLITGGDMGNRDVFSAAVYSERFGNLRLTDCVDILETDPPLQFSAVTFHEEGTEGGKRFSLTAFRGTDSSLAGWKENFMISFTRTKAQELAAEYAQNRIRECQEERNWYIAGHSKGGNLALYAGCLLDDASLEKVKHIYTLDGPGLCPEVMDTSLIRRIDGKTTFIIPEYDVVGKLFEPDIADTRIVQSYRDGIAQHSLPSWLIDHGELALAEENSPSSIRINEIIDQWIEDKPFEVRQVFIDDLFGALSADGVTDLSDMTLETFSDILQNLRGISDTTKDVITDLTQRAVFGPDVKVPSTQEIEKEITAQIDTAQERAEEAGHGERFLKIRKGIEYLAGRPDLMQSMMLLPLGLIILVASGSLLDIVCVVLIVSLTGVQLYLTLRRLKKSKWNAYSQRDGIYISIVMAALLVSLFIKDHAMDLFGSLIMGVLLLVAAYRAGEYAVMRRKEHFTRWLCTAESILAVLFGLSFIVSPHEMMSAYSVSLGILMILDGIVRIVRLKKKRKI